MKREDITPEILRELLDYNPETGILTWEEREVKWFKTERSSKVWNTRYAGKIASSNHGDGYKKLHVFDMGFKTHRVAYTLYHGKWPDNYIDHINGIPTDNRIENLRDVTPEENAKNLAVNKRHPSGIYGVHFNSLHNTWRANIKGKHLGSFEDKEDAIKARKEAEVKYGYHENHGRMKSGD